MALSLSGQLYHKSAGREIRYKVTGLSSPNGTATQGNVKAFNLIENMHAEIRGQIDVRLAGRWNAVPWSNFGIPALTLSAEYVENGVIVHTENLGNYYVHESDYDEGADEHVIRAFSQESFLRDSKFNIDDLSSSTLAGEPCDQLIRRYIGMALPDGMDNSFTDNVACTGKSVLIDQLRGLQGVSRLTAIDNLINKYDARIYADRNNDFIVGKRNTRTTQISGGYVNMGQFNRLVKTVNIKTDREQWYNAVSLKYWWSNGDTTSVTNAYARIKETNTGGTAQPMAPRYSGEKIFHQEISGGTTQTNANTEARNLLDSLIRRGELLTMTMALVPGIQPGQYVVYDGRTWLLAKTNFDFLTDEMTLEFELYTSGQTLENYTPTVS